MTVRLEAQTDRDLSEIGMMFVTKWKSATEDEQRLIRKLFFAAKLSAEEAKKLDRFLSGRKSASKASEKTKRR